MRSALKWEKTTGEMWSPGELERMSADASDDQASGAAAECEDEAHII